MLISMPTCTSTIFGVFQVIEGLSHLCYGAMFRAGAKVRPPRRQRKLDAVVQVLRTINRNIHSGLPQQSQERSSGGGIELLGIQSSILVRICRVEALFDHREIFVGRQRSIVIGVGGGELLGVQSAS